MYQSTQAQNNIDNDPYEKLIKQIQVLSGYKPFLENGSLVCRVPEVRSDNKYEVFYDNSHLFQTESITLGFFTKTKYIDFKISKANIPSAIMFFNTLDLKNMILISKYVDAYKLLSENSNNYCFDGRQHTSFANDIIEKLLSRFIYTGNEDILTLCSGLIDKVDRIKVSEKTYQALISHIANSKNTDVLLLKALNMIVKSDKFFSLYKFKIDKLKQLKKDPKQHHVYSRILKLFAEVNNHQRYPSSDLVQLLSGDEYQLGLDYLEAGGKLTYMSSSTGILFDFILRNDSKDPACTTKIKSIILKLVEHKQDLSHLYISEKNGRIQLITPLIWMYKHDKSKFRDLLKCGLTINQLPALTSNYFPDRKFFIDYALYTSNNIAPVTNFLERRGEYTRLLAYIMKNIIQLKTDYYFKLLILSSAKKNILPPEMVRAIAEDMLIEYRDKIHLPKIYHLYPKMCDVVSFDSVINKFENISSGPVNIYYKIFDNEVDCFKGKTWSSIICEEHIAMLAVMNRLDVIKDHNIKAETLRSAFKVILQSGHISILDRLVECYPALISSDSKNMHSSINFKLLSYSDSLMLKALDYLTKNNVKVPVHYLYNLICYGTFDRINGIIDILVTRDDFIDILTSSFVTRKKYCSILARLVKAAIDIGTFKPLAVSLLKSSLAKTQKDLFYQDGDYIKKLIDTILGNENIVNVMKSIPVNNILVLGLFDIKALEKFINNFERKNISDDRLAFMMFVKENVEDKAAVAEIIKHTSSDMPNLLEKNSNSFFSTPSENDGTEENQAKQEHDNHDAQYTPR